LFAIGPGATVGTWFADRTGALRDGPTAAISATAPLVGDFTGDGQSDAFWWVAGQPSTLWLAD
jgi:hypothetical protein